MSKSDRLNLIKRICLSHGNSRSVAWGAVFAPQESDIRDELSRMPCRPDAREPNEEYLLFMDAAFEGGQ